MNLANAKWLGANGIYQMHLLSRDILYWFEDYFILTKEKNVKVKSIIDAQINLYKESYEDIEPAKALYVQTEKDVVGPMMLIITIFLSIICFGGLIYYIKKMRKQQDKEVFGITSIYSEKNDRMSSYYIQKAQNETPSMYMKRQLQEQLASKEQEQEEDRKR